MASEKNKKRKKRNGIVVDICVAAIIIFIVHACLVSINPFDHMKIIFDGARPFLIPRVMVDENAQAGLTARDFSLSAEHSRNAKGKQPVLADEGQMFTVRCTRKDDPFHNVFLRQRKKLYKVGNTPSYIRNSDDLTDPDDRRSNAKERLIGLGENLIKSNYPKYKFKDIEWIGMCSMINKKYDSRSDVQERAFLAYNVNCKKLGGERIIILELKNLSIDGRYIFHYNKGTTVRNMDYLFEFLDSGVLDHNKYDIYRDDNMNT